MGVFFLILFLLYTYCLGFLNDVDVTYLSFNILDFIKVTYAHHSKSRITRLIMINDIPQPDTPCYGLNVYVPPQTHMLKPYLPSHPEGAGVRR